MRTAPVSPDLLPVRIEGAPITRVGGGERRHVNPGLLLLVTEEDVQVGVTNVAELNVAGHGLPPVGEWTAPSAQEKGGTPAGALRSQTWSSLRSAYSITRIFTFLKATSAP